MWLNQDTFDLFRRSMPIVCVDVVLICDDSALLVLRDREPAKGKWWLPGGRLYIHEKSRDCAKRKIKEETGLDCMVGPLIHVYGTDFGDVHSINLCYLAYTVGGQITLDDTSSDYGWFDKLNVQMDEYVVKCLMEAGFDY